MILISCSISTNAQSTKTDIRRPKENRRFFTFTPITEIEFRNALKNSYNAPFSTKISDTTKIEKGLAAIDKTYNDSERELANQELCKSPRCLTSFKAYYPTLDFYLFHVLDYHYAKAIFVFASTNEMASGYHRFRGEYGVMSKDGLWVGLERQDADNYPQIEICRSSKRGIWSLFTFDFTSVDINEEEKIPMFWADKNTIYIAVKEYDQLNDKDLSQFYAIKFE
ncbi:hypothetical protein N9R54_01660 [Pelobium sp.]|nr:hypothetical protein [Pelobium sp.]